VPAWFRRLVGVDLPPAQVTIPSVGEMIELTADPTNEVGEVWTSLRDTALDLAVFWLLTCLLVHLIVSRALRPLDSLMSAFRRLGAGDHAVRVAPCGAAELDRLARSFNEMAARLETMEAQNRRLDRQLTTLQEEERADLARDLHDEVGPFLFAVNIDASTIRRLAETGRANEIPAQVQAIQDAVGHMQKHVRAILGRLRPVRPAQFGLATAIGDLVAFWQRRHPNVDFDVQLAAPDEAIGETARETIYRIVQESVSNAVRHGKPGHVRVEVMKTDVGEILASVSDDGRGANIGSDAGYGLIGMRERVAAVGGQIDIATGDGGWTVTARVPSEAAMAPVSA
jgi:two-component system sensor histidine kinase UhpB